MTLPAEEPGTRPEPPGNRRPREMVIHDRIRLTGLLRKEPRQRGSFYALGGAVLSRTTSSVGRIVRRGSPSAGSPRSLSFNKPPAPQRPFSPLCCPPGGHRRRYLPTHDAGAPAAPL